MHGRESDIFGLLHPRRDVALAVQHAPDINLLWALDVKNEMGIARQWPEAQTGQVQFVGLTWRSGSRMATDVRISLLQGINEAERRLLSTFAEVVGNRIVNVPVGQLTRNDRLGRHPRAPSLAALRTRSRSPSK